jgi:hypothetical protein
MIILGNAAFAAQFRPLINFLDNFNGFELNDSWTGDQQPPNLELKFLGKLGETVKGSGFDAARLKSSLMVSALGSGLNIAAYYWAVQSNCRTGT